MLDDNDKPISFIVPREMTTKVKLIWKFSLVDVILLLIVVSFCLNIIPKMVYSPLKIPTII